MGTKVKVSKKHKNKTGNKGEAPSRGWNAKNGKGGNSGLTPLWIHNGNRKMSKKFPGEGRGGVTRVRQP